MIRQRTLPVEPTRGGGGVLFVKLILVAVIIAGTYAANGPPTLIDWVLMGAVAVLGLGWIYYWDVYRPHRPSR